MRKDDPMGITTLRRAVAVALAFVFLAATGRATADSQTYVVLVGVKDYKDPAIKAKPHAEEDVKALYDVITNNSNRSLYKPEHIKLLLGSADEKRPHELATRDNVLKAVRWALQSAKEDDTVVLAWVGQGAPLPNGSCLFTTDSTLEDRVKNSVGGADLQQELEKAKSHRILVLLDVNFLGYKQDAKKVPETGLEKRWEAFAGAKDDERDEDQPIVKPIMVLSANFGLAESAATKDHGVFMDTVIEALSGKADKYGGEADGLVTVDELLEYFVKEYPQRAIKAFQGMADVQQTSPYLSGRSTHYTLTLNLAAADKVATRLQAFQDAAKKAGLSQEIVKEGNELLSKMPRLDNQKQLRKKYQELADGKLTAVDFQTARKQLVATTLLPREEAEKFADKVLMVARLAQEGYVKQVRLGDMAVAAVKGLYYVSDEKLPKEIQDKLTQAKSLDARGLRDLLADARQHLGIREEFKGTKAADLAMERMLHSLDQHSTFIDAESVTEFEKQVRQEFIGVGIQIRKDTLKDYIRVSTPLRGSPAYFAGVKQGDLLTKVINYVDKDGKPLAQPTTTSTKGISSTDAVKLILGPAQTRVDLVMERENSNGSIEEQTFQLKRARIQVETVYGVRRNPDDSWNFYMDEANKIAYIRLSQFAYYTDRDLKKAMDGLRKSGINGLILDLRFNPGGYLRAAVEISDMFIDDGLIVSIRPRDSSQAQVYKGRHEGSMLDFPIVVLVNGGSASASEIVSACLQDQERAIVMGERSFGKGSVQDIRDLNLGDGKSQLKLTIASFWRPSGKNLNRFPNSKETDDWGVSPLPEHTIALSPNERWQLREHLVNREAVPRRDNSAPKQPKEDFTDKQLNAALQLLEKQVANRTTSKRTGG